MLPVPLHKVRLRERGYNQSAWVCAGLSESLGIPILKNGLSRKRYTETQTGKSGEERQKNTEDAFGMKHPERIQDQCVLLVDDVATTGSTINSCAGILKEAGARTVHGITLARPIMAFSRI
jgi:ComF family protein